MTTSTADDAPALRLDLPDGGLAALIPVLQKGVGIRGRMGSTVREFLVRHVGIDPDYIEKQLQTVILDNGPVDDLDAATVSDGAVLALSCAMPGLVGATMRRSGFYARMRAGIAHKDSEAPREPPTEGVVTVKLFNKALADLAPILLARPVLVEGESLAGLPLPDHGCSSAPSVWLVVRVGG
jgi:hypothetical protein